MRKNPTQLRHARRRARQRAKKESILGIKNRWDIVDLTPYDAVRLMRNEPEKTKGKSITLEKLSLGGNLKIKNKGG